MRAVFCLLVASLLPSAGCSWLIASSGINLETLPTREQVQAEFGSPRASGEVEGKPYEDYRTHRKISEGYYRNEGFAMFYVMTLGFGEFVLFPCEVGSTAKQVLVGQNLRFIYDENGKVKEVRRDGEHFPVHFPTDTP
jgi:hypothetical protein